MVEMEQSLVQQLCETNPRFRRLHEEHVLLEKKLQEFDERVYLTPEEEVERKTIQKLKLVGKDEMEDIFRQLTS
ncbi:MAG: DUF465 domain-containing protein [Desulfuromonas sp.]|nr:MAG: DUF465 domain-containing protein [Desulfuromonas sp.]